MQVLYSVLAIAVILFGINAYGDYQHEQFLKTIKGKAPTRKGELKPEVYNASPIRPVEVLAAPPEGFSPQTTEQSLSLP
jgi:hypothetical protein